MSTESDQAHLDTIGLSGGRLQGLNATAQAGSAPARALASAYSQFDGILLASGVNIGPYVKGLADIRAISIAGFAALGPLGTAALAASAAFAAWKVLSEVTQHTEEWRGKIAATTAVLLGYGDVAAETAAAKQDVLNRAIAAGSNEAIQYADAIKALAELHKQKLSDALDVSGQKLANAQREVRNLSEAKRADIARSMELGASEESIQRHFEISAEALRVLADRQKLAGDMAAHHTKKLIEQASATAALDAAYNKLMSDVKNANQLAIMEAEAAQMQQNAEQAAMFADMDIKARIRRQQVINDQSLAEEASETARIAANQAEIDAIMNIIPAQEAAGASAKTATDTAIAGFYGVAQQVQITGDGIKEWINLMRYSAEVSAVLGSGSSLFTTQSQRERIAALPARASGGPVSAGAPYMVGERGPELFVPERSGTIVPNGGGGMSVVTNITINGSVLGSKAEIARVVGSAVMDSLRSQGARMPVGA